MWGELARGVPTLELHSDDLAVTLLPDNGCDIHELLDRRTGIDLLFKTPWARRPAGAAVWAPDSQAHWLARYRGGWQVLLPNGGAGATVAGGYRGFHGEASQIPWAVESIADHEVRLSATLVSAPLRVERRVRLDGCTLVIDEAVTNTSPEPVELMWSHHPAFGPPFLDEGCVLAVDASSLRADDDDPGTDLVPGSTHPWSEATARDGAVIDYRHVPGPGSGRATLAYLDGLGTGAFSLWNPRLALGVRVAWPVDVFPVAWLWQELGATTTFPWFGRAYVMAVEPATTWGNGGLEQVYRDGRSGLTLAPGERREVDVQAQVFHEESMLRSVP